MLNDPPRPRRWPRRTAVTLAVLLVAVAGLYLRNSSTIAGQEDGQRPFLLAHRGIAQTFDLAGVTADTCTARIIHPPQVPYLENTLPSLRAAFDAGADQAEIDVQLTRDGRLAVFHDATLDCRTDGTGTVGEHTLEELRRLDVGYGYTADGGATFPLRGKGVGLLPTVPEVFAALPGRSLKLDLKRDQQADGEALAAFLATLPPDRLATVTVSGGDAAVAAVARRLPQVRTSSRAVIKDCLLDYAALGWTGHVPDSCRHRELPLPARYGRWLWGWPNLFVARMRTVDTRVILVRGEGDWSAGFDTPADVAELPDGWAGGIWTNRTDVVAPLLIPG
ncbi:glycerophosphodiester phosphodiesterase family protein [Dactylosporangium aurantiacum]|uniref:glycerophosphodiester phosphodiesterase family protein n=1 Tax=Dactylosporangium aurantiacum TaxID=35754 RepID=UPI0009DD6C1B|nr:glycerophosphodiester phosphodiesterase family protein [Dactylosporangium aurantiacum]MDG6107780.1 glycerophosphodiester phosphodiesterase family protein [Dactylosporangium aurantiacum]